MSLDAVLQLAAGGFCGVLALLSLLARPRTMAQAAFAAAMGLLGTESIFAGLAMAAVLPLSAERWQSLSLAAASFLPGAWLLFSLSYARGNYKAFIAKWRILLLAAFVFAPVLCIVPGERLVRGEFRVDAHTGWIFAMRWPGFALYVFLVLSAVLVLMNLERTLRASVGTMRWRIKFMVLGVGLIFAVRVYTNSQCLIYSEINPPLQAVNAIGLLLGGMLIVPSLLREGLSRVDVYPSQSVLYNSFTVLLAGIYLLSIGVLAQVLGMLGIATAFPVKAFFVLVCLMALSVLLLSERVRERTRRFVSEHFRAPRYDYRQNWATFTGRTASLMNKQDLCREVAKWVADTFQVLSVTVWLVDEAAEQIKFGCSTSLPEAAARKLTMLDGEVSGLIRALQGKTYPVEIDGCREEWVELLKRCNPESFSSGGNRVCVPLAAKGHVLGLITLADRVSGIPFTVEDLDLLKCVGDQVAGSLLNIRLSERVLQAKEMEAFQAMSAFFVHDLKNTASTLSLMLQNLPAHFADPSFREDALRGLSRSVQQINDLIDRLSLLRQELEVKRRDADLNEIVTRALSELEGVGQVTLRRELASLPKVSVDPDQMQKVIKNLLHNAFDAVAQGGEIRVKTSRHDGWVTLCVSDNGCGMSSEFVSQSLFRPFQTTKKRGIGIGLFLSKIIVDAHRGRIEVESQVAKGTTFRVWLPLEVNSP